MSPRHKRHVDAGTTWYSFLGAVYTGDFNGDFFVKSGVFEQRFYQ